jgi:site-specific DNA-cytosine methylase
LSTMQGGNREPKILEVKQVGFMDSGTGKHQSNNEECNFNGCDKYDGQTIVATRGRNPNNPSDRTTGSPTEQRLEINTQGVSNCLTSVQKDNLCLEKSYRIRKLTPLECFRLMGVTDVDAHKMLSVNSKTQCYKQAGNSIVVDVMCAMFRNLNIQQT